LRRAGAQDEDLVKTGSTTEIFVPVPFE